MQNRPPFRREKPVKKSLAFYLTLMRHKHSFLKATEKLNENKSAKQTQELPTPRTKTFPPTTDWTRSVSTFTILMKPGLFSKPAKSNPPGPPVCEKKETTGRW